MGGTLTYNFDPGQTVYAIIDCAAIRNTGSSSQNTSGLMISNAQFPGTPGIQEYPATGDLLVREGVVQEVLSSISLDSQNSDARLNVEVSGGAVVSPGTQAQLSVTVDSTGIVTGASVVTAGSDYVDGTGFTFLLATTAGGGDGLAEISYDVVNGEVTNPTVTVPGSAYIGQAQIQVDILGGIVTNVVAINGGVGYTNGTGFSFLLTTTNGGGDGLAEISYDVVAGSITNVAVANGGTTYADGLGQAVTVADTPVGAPILSSDVPVPTGVTGFVGNGYFPDSAAFTCTCDIAGGVLIDADLLTAGGQYPDGTGFTFLLTNSFGGGDGLAQLTFDVVNGFVTNVFVSAGGTGYVDGTQQVVSPLDIPAPVNSFLLTTTAGGGDGLAEISYTVVNGKLATVGITNGGSGYNDFGSALVTDGPAANLKDHELLYRVRFEEDRQTILLEAVVDGFGVEGASDIFADLSSAINEYETRLMS